MVQQFTKKQGSLCIWITNHEEMEYPSSEYVYTQKMNGIPMDGESGFGNERVSSYEGNTLVVNAGSNYIESISVSEWHFSGQGLRWVVESNNNFPEGSFLLTSTLDVVVIFDGWINVEQEVIDSEYIGFTCFVGSRDWFGVITVESGQQLHLLSFSQSLQSKVKIDDAMYLTDYDCLMGKIKSLSRKPV
jgi:hypothetical protein